MNALLRSFVFPFAALALFACSGGGAYGTPTVTTDIVSPGTGISVHGVFVSATLGDEGCGGTAAAAGPPSSDAPAACAAGSAIEAEPSASQAPSDGKPAPGGCGGGCRPSTVQLSFETKGGSGVARAKLLSVTLLDGADRRTLATLKGLGGRSWNTGTNTYQTWDGSLTSGATQSVTYTVSSPAWSTLGDGYSSSYRIRVMIDVDGQALTLESEVLNREPSFPT